MSYVSLMHDNKQCQFALTRLSTQFAVTKYLILSSIRLNVKPCRISGINQSITHLENPPCVSLKKRMTRWRRSVVIISALASINVVNRH